MSEVHVSATSTKALHSIFSQFIVQGRASQYGNIFHALLKSYGHENSKLKPSYYIKNYLNTMRTSFCRTVWSTFTGKAVHSPPRFNSKCNTATEMMCERPVLFPTISAFTHLFIVQRTIQRTNFNSGGSHCITIAQPLPHEYK